MSALTDEQIDDLWIHRPSIHNGELMPQLRDFARAVLKADADLSFVSLTVGERQEIVDCLPPGLARHILDRFRCAEPQAPECCRMGCDTPSVCERLGACRIDASAEPANGAQP